MKPQRQLMWWLASTSKAPRPGAQMSNSPALQLCCSRRITGAADLDSLNESMTASSGRCLACATRGGVVRTCSLSLASSLVCSFHSHVDCSCKASCSAASSTCHNSGTWARGDSAADRAEPRGGRMAGTGSNHEGQTSAAEPRSTSLRSLLFSSRSSSSCSPVAVRTCGHMCGTTRSMERDCR